MLSERAQLTIGLQTVSLRDPIDVIDDERLSKIDKFFNHVRRSHPRTF